MIRLLWVFIAGMQAVVVADHYPLSAISLALLALGIAIDSLVSE
jgi:hypothetical protein